MHRWLANPLLRLLLAAKVVLIVGYVLATTIAPKLGELFAQDNAEDEYVDAEKIKSENPGFIEELFDIPSLDDRTHSKEELGKYLNLAERKKQEIEERMVSLKEREGQLKQIELAIEGKLKKLEEEKRYFLDTVQQEKKASDERVAQLVEFYKKMAPKVAAPVFEKLDRDLVVQLFNKLPQKQITSILALMQPDVSVKLTEYYGRVRSSREYEMLREINKSLTDEFQNCKDVKAGDTVGKAETAAPI